MDRNPPHVRYLKPYQYVVQQGDDVGSITKSFGMPVGRWPELVGANPHKPRARYRLRHRCFADLRSGEALHVPACWREPRAGSMGAPYITPGVWDQESNIVDLLQRFVDSMTDAIEQSGTKMGLPTPKVGFNQVAAVIFSWWPYLNQVLPSANQLPQAPPTTPAGILAALKNLKPAQLEGLLKSADQFLQQYGFPQGSAPGVQNIPWGDVPWGEVAPILSNVDPNVWQQLTGILSTKTAPPHTTQPILLSLESSGLPDFFNPDTWSSSQYKSLPLKETTWSDMLVDALNDPRFAKCSAQNPGAIEQLEKCPQCFDTTEEFLQRLCAEGHPCDCDEPSENTNGGNGNGGNGTEEVDAQEKGKSNFLTYAMIGTGIVGLIAFGSVLASDK